MGFRLLSTPPAPRGVVAAPRNRTGYYSSRRLAPRHGERTQKTENPCTRGIFFALCLLLPLQPAAVEQIALSIADLEGEGWRLEGLELALEPLEGQRLRIRGSVRRVELPAAGETLEALELQCPEAVLDSAGVRCPEGSLVLSHPWVQRREIGIAMDWQRESGRLTVDLKDARLAAGRWSLALEGAGAQWRLQIRGRGADLARLRKLAAAYLGPFPRSAAGRADLNLDLGMDGGSVRSVEWDLHLRNGKFADAANLYLGEGIAARLQGRVSRDGLGALDGKTDLRLSAGALLTPFVYLEPGPHPIRLQAGFALDAAGKRLKLRSLAWRHPSVLKLDANAELDLAPFRLHRLQLESGETPAAALYQNYFQPLLAGTLMESVRLRGGLRLVAGQRRDGPLSLRLDLKDLSLEDAPDPALYPGLKPRFALHGLNGRVDWAAGGEPLASTLSWRGGQVLGALELGQASLQGELHQRGFRLTRPLELPLLDGKLLVDRLELSAPETESPRLDFDGILTPVSMERLSLAFGWPPLAGSLSGVLPGLSLRQGGVTVAGKLLVRIFDGDILIERLSLSDVFGFLPALRADVELRGLDLETLTRTFSFGKITGRLDGNIDELYLEGWRPVSFDARFRTPAGDDSAHYISQRAVENISDLGGAGIAGALSRTFLGFFEEFRYARLGISCKLRNGVCRMGGVEPAEQGYYLVVGSGIPQINIIGFNTQTDWDRLVEQLQQISAGGAPVVELNSQ